MKISKYTMKQLTYNPQNCQVNKKHEKSEKLSQPNEPRDMVMIKCNVVS